MLAFWPPGRALRATLTACAVALTALTACDASYGTKFGYPRQLPPPAGATVIADAAGRDDDDPMRGREVVIDLGSGGPSKLLEFYTERFPSAEGWQEGTADPDAGGGHLLCLVNHADKRFDEYVEIYPYDRDFSSGGPHRYLASISRLYVPPEQDERTANRCGVARMWFPTDL